MPDKLEVPSDDELDPAMVARLAELPPLNIQRFLALVPTCFEGWQDLLHGIYSAGLDPTARETVICRVGARAGCDYELFQHTVLAGQNGITPEELDTILHAERVEGLGEERDLLCLVADEMHGGGPMTDETYERFVSSFDPHVAVAWLILIGHYACVVRVLNGARVPLEAASPMRGAASPLG